MNYFAGINFDSKLNFQNILQFNLFKNQQMLMLVFETKFE
jgi:hypothetical protein